MRGLSAVIGALILALVVAASVALLYAAAERGALAAAGEARHAVRQAVPPAMRLIPLSQSCPAGGWLQAVLNASPVLGERPERVLVIDASTHRVVYEASFNSTGSALLQIPCSERSAIVVVGSDGDYWLYTPSLDPLHRCMGGGYTVTGSELARTCPGDAAGAQGSQQSTVVVEKAVEELLSLEYGGDLEAVWVAAPLQAPPRPLYVTGTFSAELAAGTHPLLYTAALTGPVPGVTAYPNATSVYIVSRMPISAARNATLVLKPGMRRSVAVYERLLGDLNGALHVVDREAVLDYDLAPTTGYCVHVSPGFGRYGFLHLGSLYVNQYELLAGSWGVCSGVPSWLGEYRASAQPTRAQEDAGLQATLSSAGSVGSLYIPFLVAKGARPLTLHVLVAQLDEPALLHEYGAKWFTEFVNNMPLTYCRPSNKLLYTDTAPPPPVYVAVRLYVFPANAYTPGYVIVPPGAGNVSASWSGRVETPTCSYTVAAPVDVSSQPLYVNVTITPRLLSCLGPGARLGIVVVAVNYAAGMDYNWTGQPAWWPRSPSAAQLLGYMGRMGANLLVEVTAAGAEAPQGLVAAPLGLMPKGATEAYTAGSILLPAANATMGTCGRVLLYEEGSIQLPVLVYNATAPAPLVEGGAPAAPLEGVPLSKLRFPANLVYYAARGNLSMLILPPAAP